MYLPKGWIEDPERLEKTGVPEEYWEFQEKWRIVLHLLKTTNLPFAVECIVFDAGYGEIRAFLSKLDQQKYTFVGQVPEFHSYWPQDIETTTHQAPVGRPRQYSTVADKTQKPHSAKWWGEQVKQWQTIRLSSGALVQAVRI